MCETELSILVNSREIGDKHSGDDKGAVSIMGQLSHVIKLVSNPEKFLRGVPVKDDLVKNSGVHFGSSYVVGVQLMYDSTQLVYTAESVILYSHSNEVFG